MSRKRTSQPWTAEDEKTLLQLRGQGKSFTQIGRLMRRTAAACDGRWYKIQREVLNVSEADSEDRC